ncbi:MAG: SDR family oxidoreductase [Spirochaetales bacterium]|nr:SDR family oxidoreductase [Spirochaetales bacterium]
MKKTLGSLYSDYSPSFVTGASSGIGFAIARELVLRGANVLLIARDPQKLDRAAKELSSIRISETQVIKTLSCDVSDKKLTEEHLAKEVKELGIPRLVVNCAGMAYPDYFEKIPYDRFKKTMEVNLGGIWNVLQALVPEMKTRGGTIVNISSIAGFLGVFGYTAYGASKFAVFGLSEVLRAELKPSGIRVHVLCPPDTDTPQLAEEEKTKPPETRAISGHAKLFSPDDVAKALFRGLRRKRFLIIPGVSGKAIYFLNRFFPGLVHSVMDKDIKKARDQRNKEFPHG